MSTTAAAPVAWTGADVLYVSAGEEGPHATIWTLASHDPDGGPPGDEEVRGAAATHADALRSAPGWTGGEVSEAHDAGVTILTRPLSNSDGATALAAYWALAGSVATAVITAAPGTEDLDVLRAVALDLVAAHRPTFTLTAEEVLVLSATCGLAAPPVMPSAFAADGSPEVRDAALAAARGSLVARGMLVPVGEGVEVVPDLRTALELLLTGEVSLLVTCREKAGSSTRLLGGRDNAYAELAPAGPGCLSLSTGTAHRIVDGYTSWLAPDADAAVPPLTLSVSPEGLQNAVGADSEAEDSVAGMHRLVSIQGLRRRDGAAAALELVWAVGRDHEVWAVQSDDGPSPALRLTPAHRGSIRDGLQEALLFSGP